MSTGNAAIWINGGWRNANGGERADSVDPATGEVVGQFADAGVADAEAAISAAYKAFHRGDWCSRPRLRSAVLLAYADRLEARRDMLADLAVRETGRLRRAALAEIDGTVSELRYYAGLARTIFGRVTEIEPGVTSLLTREAAGVAGLIVPWNAPAILLVRALAPALAAGCTCVVKLSPQAALFQTALMAPLLEIPDLPAGVVNAYAATRSAPSETLVRSPDVDVISFTGSSTVGKRIMAAAASTLKRLNLELGGKAPCVVFEDADVAAIAPRLAAAATILTGQQCTAADRVIVHESRLDEMRDALAEAFVAMKTGPGDDPESDLGPLIDVASRDRVAELVAGAARVGAVVVQGEVPGGALARGAFLSPSLIEVTDRESPLVQEEFFGPVLNLESFGDESEAVALANATRYGLAASVWTRDHARGRRVARSIRSGTVWLNDHNKLFAEAETGGFRESGFGRLHGAEGMAEFLATKHIYEVLGVVGSGP